MPEKPMQNPPQIAPARSADNGSWTVHQQSTHIARPDRLTSASRTLSNGSHRRREPTSRALTLTIHIRVGNRCRIVWAQRLTRCHRNRHHAL